ncbi:MAG: phosphatidate cytidylyltransferase [Elusimicrobiota bacterium]|jgi:phosphatidate cytidylyltransferase
MLLPRLLTAVVGIPLVLGLVHLGSLPFLLFVAALAALAAREYATMLWASGRGVQTWTTAAGAAVLALAVGLSGPALPRAQAPGVGLSSFALSALFVFVMLRELLRREHSLDRAGLTLLGILMVGWPFGHLVLLRELPPHGEAWTFLLFAGVWATDTAAYAAGAAMGRHRLAPILSPKKSWEGAVAGFAACTLVVWGLSRWTPDMMPAWGAVLLGAMTGIVAQFSDAAQSLVKRACGAKDSSALLPGHGGIFDRMDSFLLLAPLFYYFVVLLGKNS